MKRDRHRRAKFEAPCVLEGLARDDHVNTVSDLSIQSFRFDHGRRAYLPAQPLDGGGEIHAIQCFVRPHSSGTDSTPAESPIALTSPGLPDTYARAVGS